MVTSVDEGNTVGWATTQGHGTRDNDPSNFVNGQTFSYMCNKPITTNDSANRSTIMSNPGKFHGLVYFCEENTAVFDTIVEARINNILITGMRITIPPGEAGLFFVGPGVSEFSKEFQRGDTIMINLFKNLSESISKGTIQATMMAMVEIEIADVIP